MYDELIKVLRGCVLSKPCDDCPYYDQNGPTEQCATLNLAAADAIESTSKAYQMISEAYEAEVTKQVWVPVTERLPENEVPVLVVRRFLGVKDCPPKTYVEMAEYCYGDWVADSDEYKIARHRHTDPLFWMPLPEPPESEEK